MTTYPEIALVRPEDYGAIAEIWNEHIRSGRSTMDEVLKTPESVTARDRL